MATQHPSSALHAPASSRPYRKAPRGYGKRSAPGQRPSGAADFAFLPVRERYIAGYVDRLPEGAAMDIKSLAKDLPLYGQMAIGSALRALGVAGHLRHVRCRVEHLGQSRWVTLTYWSRAAHDNEWWATHLSGEEGSKAAVGVEAGPPPTDADIDTATTAAVEAPSPTQEPAPAPVLEPAPGPAPAPAARPAPASPAYLVLARLGQREPRLGLSAADCRVLEDLAERWFARGVTAEHLIHALTSGLPETVGSPVGFLRRRLLDKLPPDLPAAPEPSVVPSRRLLVECTDCGAPGAHEAILDGLCRRCRPSPRNEAPEATGGPEPFEAPAVSSAPAERDVHALVGSLRDMLRAP
ncbi:MarR family transcriptional regulator [Streptomyces sp. NPDC058637]|uniref:MarR family transcriptional regulator n=1 Tax=Streptomyces sp. NPDC058637 TaxID=3346569 RepID=UPI003655F0FA